MNTTMLVPLNDAQWGGQTVAYTGTAGTVTGWTVDGASAVWVVCTTAAYVRVGSGVTATTADLYVPANVGVLIRVPPKGGTGGFTVSAIQVASGGSVYAKPCMG